MKTNLLKSIFISLILLIGATNAWAYNLTANSYVYFEKPSNWTQSYVAFMIGHGSYSSAYNMSRISSSNLPNLYYIKTEKWDGYTEVAFFNTTGSWSGGEGNNITARSAWASASTTIYKPTSTNNDLNTYNLFTSAMSLTHGTSYSIVNKTQTIKAQIKNGANWGDATMVPADLTVSTYALTSATAAGAKSASLAQESTTVSTTVSAAYSATVSLSCTNVHDGYEFNGWYNANGTKIESYTVSSAATVYARFTPKTYTVTLENQGATTAGATSITATYNSAMPSIASNLPKKTGYTFKGYYDATSGGTQYYKADGSSNKNWDKTAATPLYAQWELETYTITYDNLKGATHTNPATYNINSATITFTAPTSKPTGYTFANWSPASIAAGSTDDVTVTANWTASTSAVTLNQENATTTGTTSVTATYDVTMPTIATLPTRTGYTFGGYYTGKNGEGTPYYDKDGKSVTNWNLEGAQTLYAKWEIINYTITYTNLNGATHSNPPTYTIEDKEITFTAPTARTGYAFAGWNPASIAKGSTDNKNVIANWTVNQYTLTWELNGGTVTKEGTAAGLIDYGTNLTPPILAKTGYTQNGWSPAVPNSMPAYDATYTAQWTINQYTLTYGVYQGANGNGTIQLDEETAVTSGSATFDYYTELTLTAQPFDGYKVVGWYGDEACTQQIAEASESITITLTENKTVYVKIVDATEKTYDVTVRAGEGGTVSSDESIKVGEQTSTTITATPAAGYRFVDWEVTDGIVAPQDLTTPTISITANANGGTLTANFIRVYTVTFLATPLSAGTMTATANSQALVSGNEYDINTVITFTATPNTECQFVKWIDAKGNELSTEKEYVHTLVANVTVKAIFSINQYTLTFSAGEGGHVSATAHNSAIASPATLDYNTSVTLTATPNANGAFVGWYEGPTKKSSNATYTINLTADKTLEARFTKATTIFFKPRSWWTSDKARLVVYTWGGSSGDKWIELEDYGCNGDIYTADIPAGYTGLKFVRLKPATADGYVSDYDGLNWDNKWTETGDLTVPTTSSSNLYDLSSSKWTTYAAPSYKLTIQSTANGTVAVSKVGGGALANNATIKLGDEITITFTPNDGYELSNYLINYASETETDGVYTVCGPTKIIAEFDPIAPSRTVYLRPNEDWLRDDPIMAAYAYKSTDDKYYRWYVMNTTDDDYTGAYSCKIPSEYDKIIFVRLNPNGSSTTNDGFNWDNMWNQTKALTIIDKDNDATNDNKLRFAIGNKIETSGEDYGRYDGKWEENTPIWGMIANFNEWKAENAVFMGYPGRLNTVPPFTPQHAFKLFNFFYAENSNYFGNAGTMKRENSEQWWTMDVNEQANCQMKLDAKGDYIYQLRFLTVGPELRKQISVTYPAEEMYYLNYVEGNRWSYAISNTSDNTKSDKVSFFVSQGTATIKLTDANKAEIAAKTFNIPEAGVYNFTLQHGSTPSISTELEKYTGNYYIRTDAAAGGWNAYKQAGNKMTYSSYAEQNQGFDHYFCKWVCNEDDQKNFVAYRNVKFCVANDYSHAISDELNGDEYIEKNGVPTGCVPQSANVRFTWNSKTNEVNRAYISGSGEIKDRYLVLSGDEKLTDLKDQNFNVAGLKPNESGFADMGNWIYQLDAKAGKGASIALTATYNGRVQTFFSTSAVAVASEGNNQTYPVRFIYDFKTNNLVAAWLLLETENDVQGGGDGLNANMLLMRKHHEQAQQIQLANTLSKVGTAYGVMTFDKYFLNNRYSEGANQGKDLPANEQKSIYERALYWISFPFDVRIRDVFGFGEYMDTWIMEYYDGEARAKNGAWVDSESYWTYITDLDYVLKAGVGYVLGLDLEKMAYNSNIWNYTSEVSLYFPSAKPIGTIDANQAVSINVPEHECKINRPTPQGDRRFADSNWNVIGVPRFINLNIELGHDIKQNEVIYYYDYIPATNKYTPVQSSGTKTFETMKAYIVQYAGTIDWWSMANWIPKQIAARRNADAGPEEVSFRLELAQDDITADKTFIQLQEEGATADFDMNKDLCKILNAGANIYTIVGESNVLTAGNVLPMGECEVPVGVKVDTAGEYTFRMPEGTEGMVVELIDYYTNTRTNLLLFDYTVDLSAGTCNDRFALHIQPSKSGVTTNIDQINGGSMHHEGVQKYLIDGQLYIVREGVVYDAQGHRL